jgi:hypothetical protein
MKEGGSGITALSVTQGSAASGGRMAFRISEAVL